MIGGIAVPWLDHERLLAHYDSLGGDEPARRYEDAVEHKPRACTILLTQPVEAPPRTAPSHR